MSLRLLLRSAEYDSSIGTDNESTAENETADFEIVEWPWEPVRPTGTAPTAVQIVDGVRRVEAHAIDDLDDGTFALGLFGSYAVGAVRCEGARAWILDGEGEFVVGRRYFQSGGEPQNHDIASGAAQLRFQAEPRPDANTSNDLLHELLEVMTRAEAQLVDVLSRNEDVLTITDGRLRRRPKGRRVAGYIKSIQSWYLGARELPLLGDLAVGERTPLFRIGGGNDAGSRRGADLYAWYLRIADMGPHYHHLSGIVRLEAPGALERDEAFRLADECALALPRLASSPVRDPRAPQNLTPVGALEDTLRRRLGEREWVRRLIASALRAAPEPLEDALLPVNGAGGARW